MDPKHRVAVQARDEQEYRTDAITGSTEQVTKTAGRNILIHFASFSIVLCINGHKNPEQSYKTGYNATRRSTGWTRIIGKGLFTQMRHMSWVQTVAAVLVLIFGIVFQDITQYYRNALNDALHVTRDSKLQEKNDKKCIVFWNTVAI